MRNESFARCDGSWDMWDRWDRWDECLLEIADVRSSKNGFANSHMLQSLLFDSASLKANISYFVLPVAPVLHVPHHQSRHWAKRSYGIDLVLYQNNWLRNVFAETTLGEWIAKQSYSPYSASITTWNACAVPVLSWKNARASGTTGDRPWKEL